VPSAHNKPLGFVQNNFPNRIEPGDLVRVGLANRHAGILARRDVFIAANCPVPLIISVKGKWRADDQPL
jgi:hypothetical protein